mmetsp:Transcript_111676/g.320851  ORF Transcript_111676/g.320851 Transcript_111676/m.320851 type:complete len:364 (+) Transcript_111676:562-1653(+)
MTRIKVDDVEALVKRHGRQGAHGQKHEFVDLLGVIRMCQVALEPIRMHAGPPLRLPRIHLAQGQRQVAVALVVRLARALDEIRDFLHELEAHVRALGRQPVVCTGELDGHVLHIPPLPGCHRFVALGAPHEAGHILKAPDLHRRMPLNREAPLLEEGVHRVEVAACPGGGDVHGHALGVPLHHAVGERRVLELLVDARGVGVVDRPMCGLRHHRQSPGVKQRPGIFGERVKHALPHRGRLAPCAGRRRDLEDGIVADAPRGARQAVEVLVAVAPPRRLATDVGAEVRCVAVVEHDDVRRSHELARPSAGLRHLSRSIVCVDDQDLVHVPLATVRVRPSRDHCGCVRGQQALARQILESHSCFL